MAGLGMRLAVEGKVLCLGGRRGSPLSNIVAEVSKFRFRGKTQTLKVTQDVLERVPLREIELPEALRNVAVPVSREARDTLGLVGGKYQGLSDVLDAAGKFQTENDYGDPSLIRESISRKINPFRSEEHYAGRMGMLFFGLVGGLAAAGILAETVSHNAGWGTLFGTMLSYVYGRIIMGRAMDRLTPSESFYGFTQTISSGRAVNLLKLDPYPEFGDPESL